MKKTVLSAFAVALMSSLMSLEGVAWGQAKEAAPAAAASAAPHKVALIDMAYVFKNYKKFEVLREDLKEEIAASEAEAKAKAEAVQKLQQKMKTFAEGSAEFTATEGQLAQASAEFEAFRRAAQREFLKKESQIYHTVYLEVTDSVAKYAKYYNYTLVLRFNREDLDTENAQKLIEGMNRQVVYHLEENDITLSVTEYLNKVYGRQPAAAGAAAPATPRPAANATRPAGTTPR